MVIPGHNLGNSQVSVNRTIGPTLVYCPSLWYILVLDSKCDYPAACNAMETLLLHKSHLGTQLFDRLWDALRTAKVRYNTKPPIKITCVPSKDFDHIAVGYSDQIHVSNIIHFSLPLSGFLIQVRQ